MSHLDRVAVWDDQARGRLWITHFARKDMEKYGFTDEDEFIVWQTDRLKAGHFTGLGYELIPAANIPSTRVERDCWGLKNGKVEIDSAKLAAKEAKKDKRQQALNKLGLTEDELKELIRG